MASLQGNTIKDTYKSLLKVADNGELEATEQEITDGNGNGTGVSLNTSGDVTATGTVSFGSLKDTGENITITKFVDAADGIGNNDNDGSIPTSAAVKSYVDTNVTAQDLDITDGTNNGSVDLDSQSLTFTGDAGVTATVSGQTLTLNSSALQAQITSNDSDIAGLDTRLTTAESNISSNDTDIAALQTADTTLQANIDAEETARIAADSSLQANINSEASTRSAADATLQSNIDSEASTRAAADTTLQTNIDNEEAARITADSGLQTQITSNDSDISALDGRLTTAEGNISSNDTDIAGLDTRLTTAEGNITSNDTDIAALQSDKQDISEKGQANGYAPLDSGAKIPIANLPDSVVGQVEYQGTWNASTNTPTLPSASTVKGHYYVVSVAGTYLTIDYAVGDWIISNGTDWEKVDNTDAVTTVFGRLGAIVANESDYSSFYPLISDLTTTNSNVSTNAANIASNDTDIANLQSDKYDKTGGTISGSVTVTGDLSATNVGGTLSTAAQPNITSVGTLSSLAVSGNLTVDTNTLYVDAANNYVGIRTSDANTHLDVNGTIGVRLNNLQFGRIKTNNADADSGGLTFQYNNNTVFTDGLVLNHQGNVGIGTSSPARPLDVIGSVGSAVATFATAVSGSTNKGIRIVPQTYGASIETVGLSTELAFNTSDASSSSERMRIDSSGNVLISDSTYAGFGQLQIGNASTTTTRLQMISSPTVGSGGIHFGDTTSATNGRFAGFLLYDHNGDYMRFGTAETERMRIRSTGEVGVGVEPFRNSLNTGVIDLANGGGAFGWTKGLYLTGNNHYNSAWRYKEDGYGVVLHVNGNEGDFRFLTMPSGTAGAAGALTEKMRIDNAGNVGIGTSSPAAKLDILDDNVQIRLANSTTGTTAADGTRMYLNGSDFFIVNRESANIQLYTSDTERMRITSGGDVLIGTTNDSQTAGEGIKFSASQDPIIRIVNDNNAPLVTPITVYNVNATNNGYRFYVKLDGGIANFSSNNVNLSDERVKTDITPLESYWDKFKSIEIVKFKYKDQSHNDNNIGVIAQQVESVAPEFVSNEGFGETPEGQEPLKSIYTDDLHNATIKVLQEAMLKIETLEAEIETLKSQING